MEKLSFMVNHIIASKCYYLYMTSPAFFFFLLLTAFTFAKVEIAIEGPEGWAKNLPTWRLPQEHWVSRVFFSGKQATGYHVWLELFLISILHAVYAFVAPSWAIELRILAFF